MEITEEIDSGFKKFLKGAWKFVNSRIFIVIVIIAAIIFGAAQCKRIIDLNDQIDNRDQNISALSDSLRFERDRNGELLVSIDGYISTERELKTINKRLWDQIQQQKGEILTLTKTLIAIKLDSTALADKVDELTIQIDELKKEGGSYLASWSIPTTFSEKNYFRVDGTTVIKMLDDDPYQLSHDTTYLTGFENQIDVAYGLKVENGKLRVFISSEYPGFTVNSMEGVLIDPTDWPGLFKPEKRHWFTGIGVGPQISMGWNFLQGKPAFLFGVGVHYNIYEW